MANQVALKKIAAALALLGMSAGIAQAATATVTASANVLTPLTVSQTTAMNFGDVAYDSGTASTDFTLAASVGATTVAPGGALASGTSSPGVFTVAGVAGATYTFAVDATITLNPDVGNPSTDTLTVTTTKSASTGTVGGGDIYVGGTLSVPNTAAGAYVGNYVVTVAYQ